jgi:hypothetical protein
MPGYRARVRGARDRVLAPSVQQTSSEVGRILLPELAELRRILGDQGDAADEIAEITGRTLTRLSDEIADLRAAVTVLQERLDQTRDPVQDHAAQDPAQLDLQ